MMPLGLEKDGVLMDDNGRRDVGVPVVWLKSLLKEKLPLPEILGMD